jgi:SAM-dependent methyltransferase
VTQHPFDEFGDVDRYAREMEASIAFAHVGHEMFVRAKAVALLDVVERQVGDPSELDLLDVGCGVGAMQHFVAPRVRRSVGIDPSAETASAARTLHPNSQIDVLESELLPYPDGSFDVAFAVNVLHHVDPPNWERFTSDVARVVRPGGLVVFFEQNPWNPLTRMVVGRCAFDDGVTLLSRTRVESLMTSAGLESIERRYLLFFPLDRPWARGIERKLGWLPLGAQHMVVGRRAR